MEGLEAVAAAVGQLDQVSRWQHQLAGSATGATIRGCSCRQLCCCGGPLRLTLIWKGSKNKLKFMFLTEPGIKLSKNFYNYEILRYWSHWSSLKINITIAFDLVYQGQVSNISAIYDTP